MQVRFGTLLTYNKAAYNKARDGQALAPAAYNKARNGQSPA